MSDINTNNSAVLTGVITNNLLFNHSVNSENFYKGYLMVARRSGNLDTIPIIASDRLLGENIAEECAGLIIAVVGQFRSHNLEVGGKKRTLLYVFAKSVEVLAECSDEINLNSISLKGTICKVPTYRVTPAGREIADILVAINRAYGKSDYIPCICWGRNARFISQFPVGTKVEIEGRVQSREYLKKYEDGSAETKVAYEVSVSRIDIVGREDREDESRSE